MAAFPNFFGGSVPAQSPRADQERTVNFYLERTDAPTLKSPFVLYPTPGVTTWATATSTPVRALYAQGDTVYAVIGDKFCTISDAGVITVVDTVAVDVGTDPAWIVGNGDAGGHIFIVSGGLGYCYDDPTLTTEFASGASQCAMLDGYFVVLDATTSTVSASALLDGTTWDPLSVTQRSLAPDPWVALAVLGRELWLFGTQTSEIWYDAGTTPFPFAPMTTAVVPFGIVAPASVCAVGASLLWLAQTASGGPVVVQATDVTPRIVSTHALAWTLSQYATVRDARAWSYEDGGHAFYVLTFPTANATWVYDVATGTWTERGTWNATTGAYDAWRLGCHAYTATGRHLVGDRNGPTVYTLSADSTTDVDGAAIRRLRRAPVLNVEGRRLFFSRFHLDIDVGIGTVVPPGDDPKVMLAYSNDNGETWTELAPVSAGRLGTYQTRVQWRRLGSARDRVFEVVMSDVVPWRIVNASLELKAGGR